MKKIIVYGSNKNSATDGIIHAGIENIFSDCEIDHFISSDTIMLPDDKLTTKKEYDIIMYPGSPFIWDQMQHTAKVKNLMRFRELHPNSQMIFMGIGSCLPLEVNETIMYRKEDVEALQYIFRDSIVIVRDKKAFDILSNANIYSTLLPCPSFFCYNTFNEPKNNINNILIWYDPSIGVSFQYWNDMNKLKPYIEIVKHFVLKFNPKVYCVSENECQLAELFGLEKPEIIRDREHTKEIMENANIVLSGRVHCAVPAFVQGKKLGLIPIDTRYGVLDDWGGQIITNIHDLVNLTSEKRDFESFREEYRNLSGIY
jgi:hypothetical protein